MSIHKVTGKLKDTYISNEFEQAVYRTRNPINDFELLSSFKFEGFDKDIATKLCSDDDELLLTQEEYEPISKYLNGRGIPTEFPTTFSERMNLCSKFISTLPCGNKCGDSLMYVGISGLGKTTMATQEVGNMVAPYLDQLLKNGRCKSQIIYYCTEPNAITSSRLKFLTGLSGEVYDRTVASYGIMDGTSIAHLTKLVLDITTEKLSNANDYAVECITTEGRIKTYMAPTFIILDSLSDLIADKRFDKISKEYEKGRDGSKESDQMQDLQAKSTMFTNKIIKNNAKKANIIIIYVGHMGADSGTNINGYQTVMIQKSLNSKVYYKMKGIPDIAKFSMSYNKTMDSMQSKADELNAEYGFDAAHGLNPYIQYVVNTSVEKNRSSGVSRGKSIPYVFTVNGEFDAIMSMFYYYHKVLGLFDYAAKNKIPGLRNENGEYIKVTKGKSFYENVFTNPETIGTIRNIIFGKIYLDKLYESPVVEKLRAISSSLF